MFKKNDEWIEEFSKIMIRWPLKPGSTFDNKWITRLVLFHNELRLDFQITLPEYFNPGNYDSGFEVLIDRISLTTKIPSPQFHQFNTQKPDHEEYSNLLNEFWWESIYVAKYLWRNEIPFAKYILDTSLRYKYLEALLEWYIGLKNNWSVNPGIHGNHLERYLDSKTWNSYKETYAGINIEDNWKALFRLFDLFSGIAQYIGSEMGFKYPMEKENAIRNYCSRIRSTYR